MSKRWIIATASLSALALAGFGITQIASADTPLGTRPAQNANPPPITLPPNKPLDPTTLIANAQQYLTGVRAKLTMDGKVLPSNIWATVMVAEAQHDGMKKWQKQIQAGTATGGPSTPNPGALKYAQKAAAQLALKHLLATEVTPAVAAAAAADPQLSAMEQMTTASAAQVQQIVTESNMKQSVLATTAGSTDTDKLATWMQTVLPRHQIVVKGITVDFSQLPTLLT